MVLHDGITRQSLKYTHIWLATQHSDQTWWGESQALGFLSAPGNSHCAAKFYKLWAQALRIATKKKFQGKV